MKKCCEICAFSFNPSSDELNATTLNCVRYPPSVSPVMVSDALGQPQMQVVVLPINVKPDYWCGEYKYVGSKLDSTELEWKPF